MRSTIRHPDGRTLAWYGWDKRMGYWCEIIGPGRRRVEHDRTTSGAENSLASMLWTLTAAGFFAPEDVHAAERQLQQVENIDEIADPDVRRAAEVLSIIKRAVGE